MRANYIHYLEPCGICQSAEGYSIRRQKLPPLGVLAHLPHFKISKSMFSQADS